MTGPSLEALAKAYASGYRDALSQVIPAAAPLPDPEWKVVRHANGEHPCGGPAFYLTRLFRTDEVADLGSMRVMPPPEQAWRVPSPTDDPQCSSCGRNIDPYSTHDLDWTVALLPPESAPDPPDPPPNPRASYAARRMPPPLIEQLDLQDVPDDWNVPPPLNDHPATTEMIAMMEKLRHEASAWQAPPSDPGLILGAKELPGPIPESS